MDQSKNHQRIWFCKFYDHPRDQLQQEIVLQRLHETEQFHDFLQFLHCPSLFLLNENPPQSLVRKTLLRRFGLKIVDRSDERTIKNYHIIPCCFLLELFAFESELPFGLFNALVVFPDFRFTLDNFSTRTCSENLWKQNSV